MYSFGGESVADGIGGLDSDCFFDHTECGGGGGLSAGNS